MGGVYSADGQIVVREGRGHHGYNPQAQRHNHSHSNCHQHNHTQHNHRRSGWSAEEGRKCDLHWGRRRQELIPRAKLRQRSPDYSKWDDPVRPLRHTVSFCGKIGPQGQTNQYGKQAQQKYGERAREKERGYCTLKREQRRDMMERLNDSTESGYDGGSQENILDEPHYESIRKVSLKSEQRHGDIDVAVNGKKDNEIKELNVDELGRFNLVQEENNYNEKKAVANGRAKFCNGDDAESNETCKATSNLDCNKVTIHAVIETMHEGHMPEPQMDRDSINSQESYGKSENSDSKSETTRDKAAEQYSKQELYAKLEEVYARPEDVIQKLVQPHHKKEMETEVRTQDIKDNSIKEEIYGNVNGKIDDAKQKETSMTGEKKEEKTIVQKLVKVAEVEGVAPKPPTPTPRNSTIAPGKTNEEQTFVEEEYSYEPEFKRSSSKLVLRTRSLLNLDEDKPQSDRNLVRPPAIRMKITTGPDGTFVIDGRKANSELNLSDESNNGSPTKHRRSISGEELKKRKEEIFKPKPILNHNNNKYNEEINKNGNITTKEEAIHNLKKYLKENNIGLKELLTNNNVVIIDTYTNKKSSEDLSDYNHKTARECRITGTTAKGDARESNTLPRANKVHQPSVQRHYFYKLVKSRNLPDEELPDPDKVRSTRQMFQNPKEGTQTKIMLPITAKLGNPKKEVRPTPEVRLIQGDRSPRRWTDSGSLSSGVSSDMSMLDNMSDKCYTSDEEDNMPTPPEADKHPVSPEVMNKIRACGTTITYYGGRVISHSHGSANPMTMTIMDEIRRGRDGGRGKFRLVKSNSCGSRLELAGTDEQQHYHELSHGRFYEDMYGGKPLSEEMKGANNLVPVEEEEVRVKQYEQVKKEMKMKEVEDTCKEAKPSWRELIESRKQLRAMEHNRRPCSDMVFEEYQVLET